MPRPLTPAAVCRRTFLGFFPGGFHDETYLAWERDYKWAAHRAWSGALGREAMAAAITAGRHGEVAQAAVRIESRTNLLFSFEKMALRDAVSTDDGAELFATGLHDWLYGAGPEAARFTRWCEVVEALPRRQTRVLTWPLATVFGFLARPKVHIFYKPRVTQAAAAAYGYDLGYRSRPSWETYSRLLDFAATVRRDLADLRPRDLIDVQSFLWVQGSAEYD
ncbi:MAG TPA: hypothetical protein VNB94_11825 [Mycobacteriales bacterium]|nr:hypothetical protein [Mycobacteriales bacterium]